MSDSKVETVHHYGYIVKPVAFTQLAGAVRDIGLYSLLLTEPPAVRQPNS